MIRLTSRARQTDIATATTIAAIAAGCRDIAALDEDVVRIGVVGEPPPEEGRRLIEGPAEEFEPGPAELRLKAELPCGPFRRRPEKGEHDGADEEHLAPEDLGRDMLGVIRPIVYSSSKSAVGVSAVSATMARKSEVWCQRK